MPVITADVPPSQFVSLSSIADGSSFRQGSSYWTRLASGTGGYVLCAPFGGGALSNILGTASVETVTVVSAEVNISAS